uniref:uncharacterized protein LOC105349406 n=1 Tax=Fragaria vesca subsp. vesca TaxID=101020 RepID=UPI0005CA9AE1|nr:PREDICTED: uncharacterized protein LOC105349406 [Fragaria vesca subsp. vesca]
MRLPNTVRTFSHRFETMMTLTNMQMLALLICRPCCLMWLSSPLSSEHMPLTEGCSQGLPAHVSLWCLPFLPHLLIIALAKDSSDPSFVGLTKKYFMEMLDKGLKPHSVSYFSILNAIACREPEEEAREFLGQIQAKGFSPEVPSFYFGQGQGHYTEVLKAIKLYNDLVNKTIDKDMQKVFRKWYTSGRSFKKESIKMHNALVKDGYVDEAREFATTVIQTGLTGTHPMVLIRTTVIEAYLKAGKIKGVLRLTRTC